MNYYERHLGDYAKQTGHLSMMEHGAYNLLLDRYYTTEEGIPEGQVYRVARARTAAERKAVDIVLNEYFKKSEGVWKKNRCEEEIQAAQKRIETARENGNKGGRPKTQENQQPDKPAGLILEKDPVPSGFVLGSENKTQTKALHLPSPIYPSIQAPVKSKDSVCVTETDVSKARQTMSVAASISVALRNNGVMVTPAHPTLVAWVQDGFTLPQIESAFAVARESKPEGKIAANYLDTILRSPRPAAGKRLNGKGKHETTKYERNQAVLRALGSDSVKDF